jgi:hypothetical protein
LTMQYGLIGAGPVSQYLVRWFPHLPTELGPVAANNPRLASRIVNTLRAGSALRDVSGLQDVPVILICAPGHHLESLLPFLKDAALDWRGKKIVLCNCDLFSRQMEFIRECGAHVASLRPIAGMPKRLLIEGDREAVKAARYFVTEMRAVAVEIEPDSTALFRAATTFATSLFTPILEACMQAVRGAGISGSLRDQVVESLFQQGLRSFLYSGKKSWTGTVADGNKEWMRRELACLEELQPDLAELYRATAAASARLFKRARSVPPPPEVNAAETA